MLSDRYLPSYLRACLRALWAGFGITDTLVVVVIVILFAISLFTELHAEVHPPAWLVTILAVIFILFELLKTGFKLYADERGRREALEQRLIPRLVPDEPHIADTLMQVGPSRVPAKYVRVPIRNSSQGIASRCSAKLLKIEFLGDGGWRTLSYQDTLDLPWANKLPESAREVDLGPDGVDTLDVIFAIERSRELHLATIVRAHYPNLMGLAGHYRFTFQVTSANAGSRTIRLRVHWGFDIQALGFPSDPIDIVDN